MDLLDWLSALPEEARFRWHLQAAGLLLAVLFGLFLEQRWFARRGRAASWGVLRIVSLLAGVVAVTSVALPVQAVSGPVALAVFYAALLTVAPLVWFGSHLLVGQRLRPGFSRSECVALSLSGLVLMLVLPGGAWLMARQAVQAEVRALGDTPVLPAATAPLAHRLEAPQRWRLPGKGELWTQTLRAPRDVRLERVQRFSAGRWQDTAGVTQSMFCLDGQDVHMAWPAGEPMGHWQLHWTDEGGRPQTGVYTPDAAAFRAASEQPFTAAFRPDGFDLSVPMPRNLIRVARARQADGKWSYVAMEPKGGANRLPRDTCLMPGESQLPTPARPAVASVGLLLGAPGQPAIWVEFVPSDRR